MDIIMAGVLHMEDGEGDMVDFTHLLDFIHPLDITPLQGFIPHILDK
jgi:hypothetical protein